jgi:N-acyl-D-aspartate/D-glutamate deacylase
MAADLLIRGARIVDGTGFAGYTGDVEVTAGRITRVGRATDAARRTIDADGLVVAPGFIDIHTHYEAQLHFEPTASPSSWHGVTTVLAGNCGFTLAPSRPADVEWLVHMLSRVEGMPLDALLDAVDFAGGPVGALLDRFDRRIGVNVAVFAGHCSIRRAVMGDDASTRTATSQEIAAMAELVRQGMRDGAIGFSTSQLDVHADHEGRPVPANLAAPDELIALCAAVGEFDHGVVEFLPRSGSEGYSPDDRALLLAMSAACGKPMNVNPLTRFPACPDGWRMALDFCEESRAGGHRIHPMFSINVKGIHFALESTFVLDEMPAFRHVLTLPFAERVAALRDPAVRERMRAEFGDTSGRSIVFDWDEVKVASASDPAHAHWVGTPVADLALGAGREGLDWAIDAALSEDLQTVFVWERKPDPLITETTHALIRHPLTTAGSSDGGAHLLTFCGADYTTRLLTEPVPEVLTLEQAVSRLTMQPAVLHGLWDRGMIRPGAVADLVLFDPGALAVTPIRFARDFPAGAARLVFGSEGYDTTIVAGQVVIERGEPTGALPGVAIRGGAGGTP